MNSHLSSSPQHVCESVLQDLKRYNVEQDILGSENAVVDRLLARGDELRGAYEELHVKLHAVPRALQAFLQLVLSTSAQWNPDRIMEARRERDDLVQVNREIAEKAAELADLLDRRSELHNTSGFSSDTHYHVCDVLEAAAENNYLFKSHVQERFHALRTGFDLKYWPSLGDFLRALASDAGEAIPEATDPLTAAATEASRSSKADFFKALFAAMEENSAEDWDELPKGFKLTDNTLASLVNCALDLGPDDLVDDQYVKRLRQRERNGFTL